MSEPAGWFFTDDPQVVAMPGSGFFPGSTPPNDAVNLVPLYTHPDPRVAELEAVLKIALKQLEEWEVKIDHEFGDCRQLDAIEAAGDLSEATVAVRAAMKGMN